MKEIILTQGRVALVDDEDFEELSRYQWCAAKNRNKFYAHRKERDSQGKRYSVYMHREVLKTPHDMHTDHIDGDGLNNMRANLRICTIAENQRNRGKQSNSTSKFKGVTWQKVSNKWRARITVNGKKKHIGCYVTAEEAYRAYCEAAKKYHGGFAHI